MVRDSKGQTPTVLYRPLPSLTVPYRPFSASMPPHLHRLHKRRRFLRQLFVRHLRATAFGDRRIQRGPEAAPRGIELESTRQRADRGFVPPIARIDVRQFRHRVDVVRLVLKTLHQRIFQLADHGELCDLLHGLPLCLQGWLSRQQRTSHDPDEIDGDGYTQAFPVAHGVLLCRSENARGAPGESQPWRASLCVLENTTPTREACPPCHEASY